MLVLLAACMVTSFIAGLAVSASSLLEEISAYLNKEIKMTLRGSAWEAHVDGTSMYPITYEGSTYLPVRAVAEALQVPIRWDQETKTVHIADAIEPDASYVGVVEALTITDGETSGGRDYGTGSVRFVPESDGSLTLVIYGSVHEEGDVNMAIRGNPDSGGWSSESSRLVDVKIDADGNILGEGILSEGLPSEYRITFNGKVLPETVDLQVEMEEQTESGGLDFIFNYELTRIASDPPAEADGDDIVIEEPGGDSGVARECTDTVWQTRNIFTFSGTMQMISVPVCSN